MAFPHSNNLEVLTTLMSNAYMGWESCTFAQAEEAANYGIAAVGMDTDHLVVILPEDTTGLTGVASQDATQNPIARQAADIPLSERLSIQFFAYTSANTTTSPIYTTYSGNCYLTKSQMTSNAQYILSYLRTRGWTKNAVCGMLGNMESESTINPGIWQSLKENNMSGGFGLVQWTPASKYIDWANSHGLAINQIDSQLKRIIYEVENKVQWYGTSQYPMTFSEFATSTNTAYNLACAFLYNYERPASPSPKTRGDQATYWYNTLA